MSAPQENPFAGLFAGADSQLTEEQVGMIDRQAANTRLTLGEIKQVIAPPRHKMPPGYHGPGRSALARAVLHVRQSCPPRVRVFLPFLQRQIARLLHLWCKVEPGGNAEDDASHLTSHPPSPPYWEVPPSSAANPQ